MTERNYHSILSIVYELRKARGSLAKKKILYKHKDNEHWIRFLKATLDPQISYGVTAPDTDELGTQPHNIDPLIYEILDRLVKRELTGNAAKVAAANLSIGYGEIPRLILGRSIKAGVSFKTVNNVYGDIIYVFESMKGKECIIAEYPVSASIKRDGAKVFAYVRSKSVKFTSSSGTEFKCETLRLQYETFPLGVYEGELTYKEGKMEHRTKAIGKLNSLLAGTKADLTDFYHRIYDFIPLEEWDNQHGVMRYSARQRRLKDIPGLMDQFFTHLRWEENFILKDRKSVDDYFQKLFDLGYEGLMCRYLGTPYLWRRTNLLIKMKVCEECVLICVDWSRHTNPDKGYIGSILCEGHIKNKRLGEVFVSVNVGSGLTKEDINSDEHRFLDERIEIIYNHISETENGHSLSLARFKRIEGE